MWNSVTDLIKQKTGMPSIFNDEVIIKSLKRLGISDEDAENYAIVGCYEANPDGNAYGTTAAAGLIFLHEIMLEFLSEDKSYNTYEEFYCAFREFFRNKYKGGNAMNCDLIIAFVTCVATVISTIIAILRYKKR
jgi:pyruvate-formate lyase